MRLEIFSRVTYALLLSALNILLLSEHCVEALWNQSSSLSRSSSPIKRRSLPRTITIVTDTRLSDTISLLDDLTVNPAHSWVVFGATAEDRPLRVELVSPTVNGIPYGLAISVIELFGEREDIGDLDFPVARDVRRINTHLVATTELRNAEIFNPFPQSDIDSVAGQSPVLDLALESHLIVDHTWRWRGRNYLGNSHRFVEALLLQPAFGTLVVAEMLVISEEPEKTLSGGDLARFKGELWAYFRRLLNVRGGRHPMFHRSVDRQSLRSDHLLDKPIPVNHILFEARTSQSRVRATPGRPSVAVLFQLYSLMQDRKTVYKARRITNSWSRLALALDASSHSRGKCFVSLSRDPRWTSGFLPWRLLPLLT